MKRFLAISILFVAVSLLYIATGCQGPEKPLARPAEVKADKARQIKRKPIKASKPIKAKKVKAKKKAAKKTPAVPRQKDAGKLTVDKMTYDFGLVDPKAKVKGEFILTNTGKETLEIARTGKDCGCTVPKIKTKILKPGQSVPLSVTFRVPAKSGKTTKKLWVETKPPALPERLTMRLKAEVKKHIVTIPDKLELEARQSTGKENSLVLQSNYDVPFHITGYTSQSRAIKLGFDQELQASRHTLPITVDLEKLRKHKRGSVTIYTDHPKLNSVTVPFTVIPPFAAHPGKLSFLKIPMEGEQKSHLKIVSNFSEEFELGEITSQKGLAKVSGITKTDDGYRVDVAMTRPIKFKSAIITDYLTIGIKDRPNDTIKVRCYGRILKGRKVK